jgi:phytoene desaturase
MRIIVIGSGFGGLSAAVRLQAQGHDVSIVEKLDKPGGRAYVFEREGFQFDGGPTIITAPWMIDDIFASAGASTGDYVQIVPIDPFYNVRFEDGMVFHYNGVREQVLSEIRRFNPDDLAGYERFFAETEKVFAAGMSLVDQPFSTVGSMLKVAPQLAMLQAQRSVAKFVNRYIKDPRLQQVFSFHPLLIGGNPFQASCLYTLVHTLEQKWGVHFAMGGTGALVRGLVKCFTDIGGTIRLNAEVAEIVVDAASKRATGVKLANGEVMRADAVVCNGEVAMSYMKLVKPEHRPKNTDKKLKKLDYSMSLFVSYFGTRGTRDMWPDVAHHEILMGPRYEGLLSDIFDRKHLAEDFSLYLHRPTVTDPSLAPEGDDAWYVLSPVPHLGGDTDWASVHQRYTDRILDYLDQRYLPGLKERVVVEHHVDPRYFRDTLNSHLGSAFSVEPTLFQSAYMRPHNQSEDVSNLYFAGAGTHPGAGLPGVMGSGKIVADMIGMAPNAKPRGAKSKSAREAVQELMGV